MPQSARARFHPRLARFLPKALALGCLLGAGIIYLSARAPAAAPRPAAPHTASSLAASKPATAPHSAAYSSRPAAAYTNQAISAQPGTPAKSGMPGMANMPGMADMPGMAGQASGPAYATPAFHHHPPSGPLPATQPPSKFSDPRVRTIYAMAAKIKRVLYQQPCYCRCDRELGHTSLLDCYVGDHASVCDVCLLEAAYAYQQTRQGRTPAEIRSGIEHGAFRSLNLNSFVQHP